MAFKMRLGNCSFKFILMAGVVLAFLLCLSISPGSVFAAEETAVETVTPPPADTPPELPPKPLEANIPNEPMTPQLANNVPDQMTPAPSEPLPPSGNDMVQQGNGIPLTEEAISAAVANAIADPLPLPPEANPGGIPDYFGTTPNYANSPLPETTEISSVIGPRPGTLIKGSGPAVYVTDSNNGIYLKRWIDSPATFEYWGYFWQDIIPITDSEVASYVNGPAVTSVSSRPNGQLITANGQVYFLEGGLKRYISSPLSFNSNGFRWDRVKTISQTELSSYADGSIIQPRPGTLIKGSGPAVYATDYLAGVSYKRWIDSPATLEKWGFYWTDINQLTDAQITSFVNGQQITSSDVYRPNGQLIRYSQGVAFIEGGEKRWIGSPTAFTSNGFRWDRVQQVALAEINKYPQMTLIDITTGTGLRKFIDSLPGLGSENANNLGQYIPVAIADETTYPGSEYYEIALVEYSEQMHSDLPATRLRGYVQIETLENASVSNHVALLYPDGSPILDILGSQVYAVDNPHYMGPIIISQRDLPTRIKFTNYLPTGAGGDLFLPVDTTVMGAGMGPLNVVDHIMVMDAGTGYTTAVINITGGGGTGAQAEAVIVGGSISEITLTNSGIGYVSAPTVTVDGDGASAMAEAMLMPENYTENRATLHLHGNNSVWISDGTPHQWITPANETTGYPEGVSVVDVPDMATPEDGSMTFYYTNAQSARLMFYHDHSYGITRLNVYAGEAAPYLVTDLVEADLINGTNFTGVNPQNLRVLPDLGIPLVIQDKTFVDPTTIWNQDPTWNWGTGQRDPNTGEIVEAVEGDLWYPHVYMPNQNPWSESGMNDMGRWHYAPWFWPPATDLTYPPIPNPYYDPINAPWEPPYIPATPNPSSPAEAFLDTPVVNGTVYPYLSVDPKAYRFRILNASDDRFLNLQIYVADSSTVTADGRINTEVKMVPAIPTVGFPDTWPTDSRDGGVPDPATSGPSFIQVANEGGFLPAPVVLENTPVNWNMDPTNFDMGIVNQGTLILGTAERADVIVDFSQFAGKTLILYNDAPAPFPAIDARYDYYTDNPNLTDIGGTSSTLAGFGPNTRTIMQIRVKNTTPAIPYNIANLNSVFAKTASKNGVFEVSQDDIIIPQAAYNSAYNASFTTDYAKIWETSKTFTTLAGDTITIPFQPKAIQDEMGEAFDTDYGRMSAMLGLELPATSAGAQNFVLYPFLSPPVEIVAGTVYGTPIGALDDGTQIWKITHNGVDTHTIHTHLYNAQLINRVAWDGALRPPDPNELGWKETFRVNPLQDTIIAFRPIVPTDILPFEVPNSVRLIDPTMPEGVTLKTPLGGFKDPTGQPVEVINHYVNYGWEYVYHCHLLAHEEMDMMHTVAIAVTPADPSNLDATLGAGVVLTWTDNSINESGFEIQRAESIDFLTNPVTFEAAQNMEIYTDNSVVPLTEYWYRVRSINTVGDTFDYTDPNINEGASFPTTTKRSDWSDPINITTA